MQVICNTSPLIGLMKIGKLDLLPKLFDKVIIPQAVYDELCAKSEIHWKEAEQVQSMVNKSELCIYKVQNDAIVRMMYGRLHRGELEVIIGAKELGLSVAIVDERAARRTAADLLVRTIGILGLLLYAKEKGLIDCIKPCLDKLRASGYRISDSLYRRILTDAGE